MKDRVPRYPNRRKITYEDGRVEYVTIEYADEPTQAGTLIGKATLLDDATANKYGLGEAAATVNNALAKVFDLAYFAYYWLSQGEFPVLDQSVEFLGSTSYVVPDNVYLVQVHLVGGGGGGATEQGGIYEDSSSYTCAGYMGGGAGYTKTTYISVTPGETLTIVVGVGGDAGADGYASYISRGDTIIAQADGGKSGNNKGEGGSGGGAAGTVITVKETSVVPGGCGGVDGADGADVSDSITDNAIYGGTGQGTTTRDWGEESGTLRCQGGAGNNASATPALANSGNGGNAPGLTASGKMSGNATAGCSGIVLMRWAA